MSPPRPRAHRRREACRPEARGRRDPGLRRRSFQGVLRAASAGGSTPTSASTTASASCSSRRRVRVPRCSSVRTSRRPRPAPPRACTWSCPTSRRRATSSRRAAPTSPRSSIRARPAASSNPPAPTAASTGWTSSASSYGSFAILPRPRRQRAGCSKRSRRGFPGRIDAGRDHLRVDRGPRGRDAARVGRARRARSPHRQGRSELARLVRGVHGRRAGRHTAAANEPTPRHKE